MEHSITTPISISVRSIRKTLGANQALDRTSVDFASGVLHGLIGPEGAGKTTLLRTIMGLLKPDQGEVIYLENKRPVEFARVRPSVAYMPQQQSLYPDLSIAEHLAFFQELYQIPEKTYQERSENLLQITRLSKFRDRPAGKLSGGMYKKLGLMCALLQSPNAILLDEPTNGVDPISRREFWDLLYDLLSTRILIIVATAYMDEAERCGQVHLLSAGQMIASGEPRALLEAEKVPSIDALFIKRDGGRPTA